ncbi:MAG: NusG domain II-containing protein [Lachnospiraceae bacterium]|nr:NusG domain II-containing protein [Lachnospiraceae bacterium]
MLIGKREKISEEQNKKLELYAIIGITIFAIVSYLITNFVIKKDTRNVAVFVNGKRVTLIEGRKIDLNAQGTYVLGGKNGEYNVIEIKDHKIRCIDANCPDKVCVNHGYLNPDVDNDMIVCAPHGLLISYE